SAAWFKSGECRGKSLLKFIQFFVDLYPQCLECPRSWMHLSSFAINPGYKIRQFNAGIKGCSLPLGNDGLRYFSRKWFLAVFVQYPLQLFFLTLVDHFPC